MARQRRPLTPTPRAASPARGGIIVGDAHSINLPTQRSPSGAQGFLHLHARAPAPPPSRPREPDGRGLAAGRRCPLTRLPPPHLPLPPGAPRLALLVLPAALVGCPDRAPPAVPAAAPATFAPLEAAPAAALAAASAYAGAPLRFVELVRTGDRPGGQGERFGQLHDAAGAPLDDPMRPPFLELCNEADFNALLPRGDEALLITHFECSRGALYGTTLTRGPDGAPVAAATRALHPLAPWGIYNPCAGQVTPWGSHLSSEEYEPEARDWDPSTGEIQRGSGAKPDRWWADHNRAFPDRSKVGPYRYGWVPELTAGPRAADPVTGQKHLAMGRFSHELSLVLPDQRTVYQSDDGGKGVGWFLFVADRAGDLGSGTLYAARWSPDPAGAGPLAWISLGHATQAQLQPLVDADPPLRFAELFTAADPGPGGSCPTGTRLVQSNGRVECLGLQAPSARVPDPALAASRLETRRYAALLGATTELEKGEGVAYDPARKTVYLALSTQQGTMLAGPADSGADHVQLAAPNPCGGVYGGPVAAGAVDSAGQPIPSELVMTSLAPALLGRPDGGGCHPDGIANPDNITFAPELDLLFIGEDTHRHDRAALWAWQPGAAAPQRVMVAPPEGEITGLAWVPELFGAAWLTVSVQHPHEPEAAAPFPVEVENKPFGAIPNDARSVVGLLGPFGSPAAAPPR